MRCLTLPKQHFLSPPDVKFGIFQLSECSRDKYLKSYAIIYKTLIPTPKMFFHTYN